VDTAGASSPVTANRPVANGRSVAALDDRPILNFGPIEPSDTETAARRLLGDKEDEQDTPEQQTPASFFGRFEASSEAFAAALSIERLDELEDESRFDAFRGPKPFSGLVVRAVNLYEATAQFLTDTPSRGAAVNANS